MRKMLVAGLVLLLLAVNVLPVLANEVAPTEPEMPAVPVGTAADDRPLYSVADPPDFPVFNSVVDGELGDEQHFVSIQPVDCPTGASPGDVVKLEPGQTYEGRILYCNDGVSNGIRNRVYANDAKVKVVIPAMVEDSTGMLITITASNTTPEAISELVTLESDLPLSIEYVDGSAHIESNDVTNKSLISAPELFGDGALIGTNSLTGIVLDGTENSGYVVFRFQTAKIEDLGLTIVQSPEKPKTNKPKADKLATTTKASAPEATKTSHEMSSWQAMLLSILIGCIIAGIVVACLVVKGDRENRDSH